ncbi:VOC family protein [Cryptosporangium aurantiacum]|uniref:Catechol 2,3-dioxygenase n=1 Tax=Cryptosporangium aurantiacum TaxID=134849 RepID=A0A1M7PD68_9ACTN|nr:VOC family protein [Cryptosporangium aurantiacum]SHN14906.1 Catechol 2,3-dioxygenase [Cryptosporangium aurantiacum]
MAELTEPRWTHVALPVTDLERSIEFYTTVTPLVLVTRNVDDNGQGAWLSNKNQVDSPFVLVLAEFKPEIGKNFGIEPGRKATTLAPFAHLGIELPNREDVDAVAEKARAVGALEWEPRDMAAHIGYICAVKDPDGNTVEFSHNQKVFSTITELWG